MVVKRVYIPAHGTYTVDDISDPFNPTIGSLIFSTTKPSDTDEDDDDDDDEATALNSPRPIKVSEHVSVPPVQDFLHIASLCNLATVHKGADGNWHCRGDPTEIGIQVFANRFDYGREKLMAHLDDNNDEGMKNDTGSTWTQLAEFPFDSDVKRMSVVFRRSTNDSTPTTSSEMVFLKGAVERVLDLCVSIRTKEGDVEFTEDRREEILKNMEALAGEGLRVLALASREWDGEVPKWKGYPRENVEKDMVLLGLVGLYDPPRPESYGKWLYKVVASSLAHRSLSAHRLCEEMPSRRNRSPHAHRRSQSHRPSNRSTSRYHPQSVVQSPRTHPQSCRHDRQ